MEDTELAQVSILLRILVSTVLVSTVPLYPPTMSRLLPIAVPDVKECATFVFGPVVQLLPAMS